ncbi:MAG TPA: hypothetical protein VIQ02_00850 [Jiangellaceae bacterium]
MESILIPMAVVLAVIVVLVAVVSWSRRGQSSIGRESGADTAYARRQKELGKDPRIGGAPPDVPHGF